MGVYDYLDKEIWLIDEVRETVDFVIVKKWKVVGSIKGLAEIANSQERLIAAQRGVTTVYTIMVDKSTPLEFENKIIIKNALGKLVFLQITTPPQDNRSQSASNILSYQAESWVNAPPNIERLPS